MQARAPLGTVPWGVPDSGCSDCQHFYIINAGKTHTTQQKEQDKRIDNFGVYGTEGKLVSTVAFNQQGELSYTITVGDTSETKTISVPDNYGLEVAQLGRCIAEGEERHITEAFSVSNAEMIQDILNAINY